MSGYSIATPTTSNQATRKSLHRRFITTIAAFVIFGATAGCVPTPPETPIANGVTVPSTLVLENPKVVVTRAMIRFRTVMCNGVYVGSGFAIDKHTIITNRHVVGGASEIDAVTWDGTPLHVVSSQIAPDTDLAVVKVSESLPATLTLAKDEPIAGLPVSTVGYALGKALKVNDGKVIEDIDGGVYGEDRIVLTTAKVQHGNSGGPLVNTSGVVVGVVFAITTGDNTGLALPVTKLHEVLDDRDLVHNPSCDAFLARYGVG